MPAPLARPRQFRHSGAMKFLERLVLAALRRLAPRASTGFRESAINISVDGEIARLLAKRDRDGFVTVATGPFAGLKLLTASRTTGHIAKVLGLYERQVAIALQQAARANPTRFINVGSGDGYYLVAMGRLLPQARLIGFDTSDQANAEARKVLDANGMADRAELRGHCDRNALAAVLAEGSLLLVDCEGYEADLLDPEALPELSRATMVVELHDFARPGVTELLRQRFAATHRIDILDQDQPLPTASPDLAALPESIVRTIVSERRSCLMRWMVMVPHLERRHER